MRELPKGWEYETLGKISSKIGSGSTPRGGNESYQASGIPLIRSMNVHFDGLKYDGLAFLDDAQAEKLKNVEVLHDDVLLNITGASIGRVAIAPKDMSGARVNQHVSIIRLIHCIDPHYVRNFIASPEIQSFILETEAGVTRQALTKEKIENLEIPLPPLNEQKRIANRLDLLLTRIDKTKTHLDRIPPLLKRFRQSVLAAATSGKLTEDWREANGVDLDDWQLSELEPFLCTKRPGMKTGPFGSLLKKSDYQNFGIPVVGIENISESGFEYGFKVYISQEKALDLDTYDLQPNDVIISRSGTVGEICIIPDDIGEARFSSNTMRLVLNLDLIDAEYFVFLFRGCSSVLEQIADLCKGSTRDFLNQKILKSLMYPLPPLSEQHEIVRRVETLFAKADRIEAQYQRARQAVDRLTPALLAKAFRGELVPQDPNDEPASVLLEKIKAEKQQATPKQKTPKSRKPAL